MPKSPLDRIQPRPRLDPAKFPAGLCDFVAQCLRRDETKWLDEDRRIFLGIGCGDLLMDFDVDLMVWSGFKEMWWWFWCAFWCGCYGILWDFGANNDWLFPFRNRILATWLRQCEVVYPQNAHHPGKSWKSPIWRVSEVGLPLNHWNRQDFPMDFPLSKLVLVDPTMTIRSFLPIWGVRMQWRWWSTSWWKAKARGGHVGGPGFFRLFSGFFLAAQVVISREWINRVDFLLIEIIYIYIIDHIYIDGWTFSSPDHS